MDDKEQLLQHVRERFGDLHRQLEYAEFLDGSGEVSQARYVRLWVELQSQKIQAHRVNELHEERRELIDEDPRCWQWDNFLALRWLSPFGKAIRNRIGNGSSNLLTQANEDDIALLEEMIGTKLPIGYREYISTIADGISLQPPGSNPDWLDPVFDTRSIIHMLEEDRDCLERARTPHELTWDQLMGINDPDHPVRPRCDAWDFDEEPTGHVGDNGIYLQEHNGMLCIRGFQYTGGGTYLALHGDLRGVVFVCSEGHASYWSMENWGHFLGFSAEWTKDYERDERNCSKAVRCIPLDTISVLQLETLSYWLDYD